MEEEIKRISLTNVLRINRVKLITGKKNILEENVFLTAKWVEDSGNNSTNPNKIEIMFGDNNRLYMPVTYECSNVFCAQDMFRALVKFLKKYENHVMYEENLFNLNPKSNGFVYPRPVNKHIKLVINPIPKD